MRKLESNISSNSVKIQIPKRSQSISSCINTYNCRDAKVKTPSLDDSISLGINLTNSEPYDDFLIQPCDIDNIDSDSIEVECENFDDEKFVKHVDKKIKADTAEEMKPIGDLDRNWRIFDSKTNETIEFLNLTSLPHVILDGRLYPESAVLFLMLGDFLSSSNLTIIFKDGITIPNYHSEHLKNKRVTLKLYRIKWKDGMILKKGKVRRDIITIKFKNDNVEVSGGHAVSLESNFEPVQNEVEHDKSWKEKFVEQMNRNAAEINHSEYDDQFEYDR